jgi:hypothetical protein
MRFAFDENRLLTIGSNDRCVIQWKCSTYATNSTPDNPANADSDAKAEPQAVLSDEKSEDMHLETRGSVELREDFMPYQCDVPIGTCAYM